MALERILAHKKHQLAARRKKRPKAGLLENLRGSTRSLKRAMQKPTTGYILEIKRASPSLGLIRPDFDLNDIANTYRQTADAISILTDQTFFQGRLEYLQQVRQLVDLPLLCKDFVIDPYQIYEARFFGADAILLMVSVLSKKQLQECLAVCRSLNMDALVEIHNQAELQIALECKVSLIGINNRDLKTLRVDLTTTQQLAPRVPKEITVVCESGIQDHQQAIELRPMVDGFLVGSALMRQNNLARACRELIFGRVKVCGLANLDHAETAWQQGASWGGLIFAKNSPRQVQAKQAGKIRQHSQLLWAGVFVEHTPDQIAKFANALQLDAVQLHGVYDHLGISQLRSALGANCQIFKTHRVSDAIRGFDLVGVDRILLDTYHPDLAGGTGQRFDWNLLKNYPQRLKLILAGGLAPDNIVEADKVGVWALDVNSGVEDKPGRKSPDKLRELFQSLKGGPR